VTANSPTAPDQGEASSRASPATPQELAGPATAPACTQTTGEGAESAMAQLIEREKNARPDAADAS